jgi:hypothetical protein
VLRQARVRTSLTAGVQAVWLVKDVGRARWTRKMRGGMGRVSGGAAGDVRAAGASAQVSLRRVGRGLAFESWLLAGETYLHVQSVRSSWDERLCAKLLAGKLRLLGLELSVQADGKCRPLRHDHPSKSGT